MMDGESYGAVMERGVILRAEDGAYIVQSYSRDGVTTPKIRALGGKTYAERDWVFFFLFDDGTGRILDAI